MATQIQFRRGTTAGHTSFTGAAGELTIDTDKDTIIVHDGSTTGGANELVTLSNTQTLTNKTLTSPNLTSPSIGGTAITATAAELNYCDGVTSNIQTQINNIDTDLVNDSSPQLAADLDGQGNNLYSLQANFGSDSGDYIGWTTDTQMDIYVNGSNEFRFEADGDLHADGDVIAYSSTTASDEKLKTGISNYNNALDTISRLNGVEFTWKKDGTRSAGVIAQNVEEVMPYAVKEVNSLKGEDTHLTVNYNALHSIYIEAIKELKARIEELESK